MTAVVIGTGACQRQEWSEPDLTRCPESHAAGVGGADEAPVVLTRVEPDFGKAAGVKGIIIIETVIARSGDVCAIRVLRGVTPAADAAALAAVQQWRFIPAKKAGQPVQAVFNISVPVGS